MGFIGKKILSCIGNTNVLQNRIYGLYILNLA